MEFKVEAKGENGFEASYSCSCGCHPAVQYQRQQPASDAEHCCCGTIFLVGPEAPQRIQEAVQKEGKDFNISTERVLSPWGERVEAVLAVPKG